MKSVSHRQTLSVPLTRGPQNRQRHSDREWGRGGQGEIQGDCGVGESNSLGRKNVLEVDGGDGHTATPGLHTRNGLAS